MIYWSTIYSSILIVLIIQNSPVSMIKTQRHKRATQNSTKQNVFFNEFRRYNEIKNYLDNKTKRYPNLTTISSIGKTVEGRDIKLIKIGEHIKKANKPIIFIDGGTHAREWAAITTALYIIESLIKDYVKNGTDAKLLLKEYDFFIVPLINVDGYEFTHTKNRMWRKNRAKNTNSKCIGVDLNRNYPFQWGGEGSSHKPCSETFCGSKPLSEPESNAVNNLILANKKRMKAYITLHSYGNMWLYPWGYNNTDSPNLKELKRVANIGYSALKTVYGTTYKVGSPGQLLYLAQGSGDFAHGEAKIPYVYTLEVRPNDNARNGFILPKANIIPVGKETYAGIKAVGKAIINTKCKDNICQ